MKISILEGQYIRLKLVELKDIEELFHCSRDLDVWKYLPTKIETLEEMKVFIEEAILLRERGEQYPFVVIDTKNNQIVGMTRYLRIIEHTKSQKAIERIGAKREGILRKKYRNQDFVFFSIINEEWSEVNYRLEGLLTGECYDI